MNWGLVGAFAAAASYGAATILQAIGARRGGELSALDISLVRRLASSAPYLSGLLLDAVGFALSLAALRTLPLFTVEAIVSASLAVTAVLAAVVLNVRPAAREWTALLAVSAGLALLAVSAKRQSDANLSSLDRSLLVMAVVVVGAIGFIAARRRGAGHRADAWALGAMAGLMYGGAGIGARILHDPHPVWHMISDPALYAMALAGLIGTLMQAMALQRGTVTVVTSSTVVAETVMPAVIGICFLGDRPRHGAAGLAAAGFVLAVLGAIALARFGEAAVSPASGYPEFRLGTLPAP